MKRTLAFLILITLLLTSFCAIMPVGAEEQEENSSNAELFPESEGWIAISDPSQWATITPGNKYYLTNDITFGTKQYMPSAANAQDIIIDGNNYTVTISQNQKALFSSVTNLTLRNIVLDGELIYGDHAGLKSPIVQWENYGPTMLTNVTSRVNYTATSSVSTNVSLSGVIVNAPSGSVYERVTYEGRLSIEMGTVFSAASGLCYTASGATFIDCANKGTIRVKGVVTVPVDKRSYFSVGGICGQTTGACEFIRCSNSGSIVYDAQTYQSGGVLKAQAAIGGILGYSYGDTLVDCESSCEISLKEYGSEIGGGYIGGIVGYCERKVKLKGCVNKGNILCEEDKYYVGGLVGDSESSKLNNCSNLGEITVEGKIVYVGGLQGYVFSGNADAEGCVNEGNIAIGESCATVTAGGIYGAVVSTCGAGHSVWLENSTNSGNISANVRNDNVIIGGFVGSTTEIAYLYAQRLTNSGDLTNGMNRTSAATGGIIGLISKVGLTNGSDFEVVYDISNCINAGDLYGNDRVGGIVGGVSQLMIDGAKLTVTKCTNRGEISAISTAGGILGYFNESSYRSGDTHYSNAGIKISYCENLCTVYAEKVAGGIIGAIWDTKATPKIEIDACSSAALVGSAVTQKAGGFVGNAVDTVTVTNSVCRSNITGKEIAILGFGSIESTGNLYLEREGIPEADGASPISAEELAIKRSLLGILVYSTAELENLLESAKALKKEQYSAASWVALSDAIERAEPLVERDWLELTQSEVYNELLLLQEAIDQLEPKKARETKPTVKVTAAPEEEGCGGSIGGIAVLSVAVMALGFTAKKKED